MGVYLQVFPIPNQISEIYSWKITREDVPIGFIYLGPEGMTVDWIAFADGYTYPKVDNVVDAINAVQSYLDWRWANGTLNEVTYIN